MDSTYLRHFHAAAALAGLDADWTPHDLRHHYASVLLRAGVDVAEVAARLGDTIAVVQQTYAHMIPNKGDRTRDAVRAAWG